MLDLADVASYLIDRKLVTARAVVDGGLRVRDESRLNRVFVVTAKGQQSLVLKYADGLGRGRVAREAAVLERLWSLDRHAALSRFLPPIVRYEGAEGVLVLGTTPDARDLARHHESGRFSRVLAREMGRALARLHAMPLSAVSDLQSPPDFMWSLRVHEPDLDSLRTSSGAAIELTRIVQTSDELWTALDELVASWTADAVIHGDVRWDNCLACRSNGSNRWTQVQLIDWELCGAGDPAWDIGSFLAEYICAWLRSIPIADPRQPDRLLAHAVRPLRQMRPALSAFWDAYVRQRNAAAPGSKDLLPAATRYAAVRLLVAALEEAQTLAELRPSMLHALSVSQNMLTRPRETAELLGLRAWRTVP